MSNIKCAKFFMIHLDYIYCILSIFTKHNAFSIINNVDILLNPIFNHVIILI